MKPVVEMKHAEWSSGQKSEITIITGKHNAGKQEWITDPNVVRHR
jgi:hypothetical protein